MNTYRYKAVSKQGAKVNGVIEAYDEFSAVSKIKESCSYITDIAEVQEKTGILTMEIGKKQISAKALSIVCSQFSVLIHSGLNLTRISEIIAGQTGDKRLSKILFKVSEDVSAGYSLAASLENHGDKIPLAMIETIRSGEESGSLERSFDRLSAYFEKSYKIKAKISNALTYPLFVLAVAVAVMILMMAKVIPTFLGIFDEMDIELPITTKMLISMSDFFSKWYLVIFAVMILIFLVYKFYQRTDQGRERLAEIALKLPVIGRILSMNAASQYATTMSTLLSSGISMRNALRVTMNVLDNYYLGKCTGHLVAGIESGHRLGNCMEREGCYPKMLTEMTIIGEETGTLDEMLEKTALYFDNEVDTATTKAIALLEPALLICTAVLAGFIVISLYLPMFSMYGAM